MSKKVIANALLLADTAVFGMQEKKAHQIVKIDLTKLNAAVADYFVICHGDSSTQVEAIADSVEEEIRKKTGEKPYGREGQRNAQWILLDYVNVVVHIFLKDNRDFFGIEDLWGDGIFTRYEEE